MWMREQNSKKVEAQKRFKCMKTERNEDGTYTVDIDGVKYHMKDTYELAHFLEDLGI